MTNDFHPSVDTFKMEPMETTPTHAIPINPYPPLPLLLLITPTPSTPYPILSGCYTLNHIVCPFRSALSVADPGFPVGMGANLVGAPTPNAVMFRKLFMSTQKNPDPWGGGAVAANAFR